MFNFDKTTALVVVDPQNDFMPGGALPVKDGHSIVSYINQLIKEILLGDGVVVYTADFHPVGHSSFKAQGGIWPDHCVQFSDGAKFHPDLDVKGPIFMKGYNPAVDSYSGFGGMLFEGKDAVSLEQYLKSKGILKVIVVGLALDYCVKATALDAHKAGFLTLVDLEGTRAVNVNEGDDKKTINELLDGYVMVLE